MANVITVNAFNRGMDPSTPLANTDAVLILNVNKIVSIRTKTTPWKTTGITEILYQTFFNNSDATIAIVVTQTAAATATLCNAALA